MTDFLNLFIHLWIFWGNSYEHKYLLTLHCRVYNLISYDYKKGTFLNSFSRVVEKWFFLLTLYVQKFENLAFHLYMPTRLKDNLS